MSPRHFSKAMSNKTYRDPVSDQLRPGMNLWFAFTTITGLDKAVTKLFVFTPKEINNYAAKHPVQGK